MLALLDDPRILSGLPGLIESRGARIKAHGDTTFSGVACEHGLGNFTAADLHKALYWAALLRAGLSILAAHGDGSDQCIVAVATLLIPSDPVLSSAIAHPSVGFGVMINRVTAEQAERDRMIEDLRTERGLESPLVRAGELMHAAAETIRIAREIGVSEGLFDTEDSEGDEHLASQLIRYARMISP